jgi:hypothetical protein
MALLLVVAALLSTDPNNAAVQEPTAPAQNSAAAPVKQKKVCKSLDGDTGTHMPRRICKTTDEWTAFDRGEGRSADELKALGAR